MLDKSIPYKNITMRLPAEKLATLGEPVLPKGYAFRMYQPGDGRHWAKLETSVLEFPSEEEAMAYFQKEFLPYEEELKRRCVFVINPQGLPVATTTAWTGWAQANASDGTILPGPPVQRAIVHWVSTCPEFQGLGLGKAVVLKVLSIFRQLQPGEDILLHTQTWSHVAIHLYRKLGFVMARQLQFAAPDGTLTPNDYEEAIAVLKEVEDPAFLQELIDTAV